MPVRGAGERTLCAIYTRLSKEDEEKQHSESESIQNQKALLTSYAAQQGWDVYHIYCDEDYSGADSLRPDFNRMLRAAREKKFQILLCKSQSRFTRDMELVEKYIHGLFPLWGIRFIAVADNADTEIRGNKKARQINGLVNEWYLEDLSENIRMVFDLKRRQGQYIGGYPVYGYQKDPRDKNHLIVEPEAAGVVRQIFQWALEGRGKQSIARMLNAMGVPNPTRYKAGRGWNSNHPVGNDLGLWSKTTVWRILHNEMYTGTMVQGRSKKVSYKSKATVSLPREQWFRVEGTHEAIIDPDTFQRVQQLMALRTRQDGGGEVHPLAGLVKCMDCGSTMSKTSNGRKGAGRVCYLRCQRYAGGGGAAPCTRHSIRLDRLTGLVLERLRSRIGQEYDLESLALPPSGRGKQDGLAQEQKALRAQLDKRDAALKSLYLDKVSGLLTPEQFVRLSRDFLEEKDRLEARLARLDGELARREEHPGRGELLERAQALLQLENLPRELAAALIEQIEVGQPDPDTGEQQVRITWKC